MAKKKIETKTIECWLCHFCMPMGDSLYCSLKMFDNTELTETAKVSIVKDCLWYREIKK